MTTCDYKVSHGVELPCFREYVSHNVRLSYVWKTFVSDQPVPGRYLDNETAPSRSFSNYIVRSLISRHGPPDQIAIEAGTWDHYQDPQPASNESQPSLAKQLAEWIADIRSGPRLWHPEWKTFVPSFVGYDGPITFVQPVDSPPDFDRVIRGLDMPAPTCAKHGALACL